MMDDVASVVDRINKNTKSSGANVHREEGDGDGLAGLNHEDHPSLSKGPVPLSPQGRPALICEYGNTPGGAWTVLRMHGWRVEVKEIDRKKAVLEKAPPLLDLTTKTAVPSCCFRGLLVTSACHPLILQLNLAFF